MGRNARRQKVAAEEKQVNSTVQKVDIIESDKKGSVKPLDKKKLIIIISIIVSIVIASVVGTICVIHIIKNKESKLKTQEQVVTDINNFRTSKDYFLTYGENIVRFDAEKDKNIIISIEDDIGQKCYDGFKKSVDFLNKLFETINGKYKWELLKESEIGENPAVISIKKGDLENNKSFNTVVLSYGEDITGANITIDIDNADKLSNSNLSIECLKQMLITLGLKEMDNDEYWSKTILTKDNYSLQLKLLPYDIRNLIVAYATIKDSSQLENLKKFTINKDYVTNTGSFQDLDIDYSA